MNSSEEISQLYMKIRKAKNGCEMEKEWIGKNYAGLVKSLALKYKSFGYEMDDLIQTGYVGLVKALNNFDFSHGVTFSTYAVPFILGEIKRLVRDDNRIKVSRQMKQEVFRLKKIRAELTVELGNSPRLTQLAEAMGVSREKICEIMIAEENIFHMNSIDNLENVKEIPDAGGENSEDIINRIWLSNIFKILDKREKKILLLRYYRDKTQAETAGMLGISQVHVSRLEKETIRKIRDSGYIV